MFTSQPQDAAAAADTLSAIADSAFQAVTDTTEVEGLLGRFGLELEGWMATAGAIALVVALTWILVRIADGVTKRWQGRFEDLPLLDPARQRVLTTAKLGRSAVRYIAWPLAGIVVFSELGIDVGALIATAGIAGIAIGFGAQALVKDLIAGVLLLFDDSIHVGDRIRFGTDYAVVEEIGVRLIKARKFDGELMMIPAGELRVFGNTSIGFARAIVEVGLAYEQDMEEAIPVLQDLARRWAAQRPAIMLQDEPDVMSITNFADSAVTVRIVAQVSPGEQFQAERDLRRMLKTEFDRRGIEIPFPRRTVYTRSLDPAGSS